MFTCKNASIKSLTLDQATRHKLFIKFFQGKSIAVVILRNYRDLYCLFHCFYLWHIHLFLHSLLYPLRPLQPQYLSQIPSPSIMRFINCFLLSFLSELDLLPVHILSMDYGFFFLNHQSPGPNFFLFLRHWLQSYLRTRLDQFWQLSILGRIYLAFYYLLLGAWGAEINVVVLGNSKFYHHVLNLFKLSIIVSVVT